MCVVLRAIHRQVWRTRGAFAGLMEKIPYLKALGITQRSS